MNWRISQSESRNRYLEKFNAEEVERYEVWIRTIQDAEIQACIKDIESCVSLRSPMKVLDVGAGTGALCTILSSLPHLSLTAMEPCPAMLDKLRSKEALKSVETVQGFCDSPSDRPLVPATSWDLIVSRQLANGLYDPLSAFTNWLQWLKPSGTAIVIDGIYDRDAWSGVWAEEVDRLPLSANRSMAGVAYLMEKAGFHIQHVDWMEATNALPSTRTKRYMVVATKL